MASQQQPVSIWLDCDTGHDDAFAILLLAHDPACRMLGVSTVHGNAPVEHTVVNTKAVFHAIGKKDVRVHKGCSKPSVLPACFAANVHGETGLDGVTLLPKVSVEASQTHDEDTIAAMCDTILAEPPDTVWLVATGPLTNIAKALETRPGLASHIRGLSIMGGAVGSGYTDAPLGTVEGEGPRSGNTTPFAEFNIYADPHAAERIFSDPKLSVKTTLITLDLSHNTRATESVREKLFHPHESNRSIIRRLFEEINAFFGATYQKLFAISDGPPLHDPLTIIAVAHPEWLDDHDGERWDVSIALGDKRWDKMSNPLDKIGQTVLKPAEPGTGVRIPRGIDLNKFWNLVDDCLRVAEEASSK